MYRNYEEYMARTLGYKIANPINMFNLNTYLPTPDMPINQEANNMHLNQIQSSNQILRKATTFVKKNTKSIL